MGVDFYFVNSFKVSEFLTKRYSTSFSMATSLLEKEKREAIYGIYGFVRLADEVVDSFHGYDKAFLLKNLNTELAYALNHGISTNPVLTSFALSVKKYKISIEHIDAFMKSMEFDLTKSNYTKTEDLAQYIYGSADVVGLMCLKVFCNGDEHLYQKLEYSAQKLGSAFQKVNFLRDLNADKVELGRNYFPEIADEKLDNDNKKVIENSINADFKEAWVGVKQLPGRAKLAVAIAYFYYFALFEKIVQCSASEIACRRIRISNLKKYFILTKVALMYKTKLI